MSALWECSCIRMIGFDFKIQWARQGISVYDQAVTPFNSWPCHTSCIRHRITNFNSIIVGPFVRNLKTSKMQTAIWQLHCSAIYLLTKYIRNNGDREMVTGASGYHWQLLYTYFNDNIRYIWRLCIVLYCIGLHCRLSASDKMTYREAVAI